MDLTHNAPHIHIRFKHTDHQKHYITNSDLLAHRMLVVTEQDLGQTGRHKTHFSKGIHVSLVERTSLYNLDVFRMFKIQHLSVYITISLHCLVSNAYSCTQRTCYMRDLLREDFLQPDYIFGGKRYLLVLWPAIVQHRCLAWRDGIDIVCCIGEIGHHTLQQAVTSTKEYDEDKNSPSYREPRQCDSRLVTFHRGEDLCQDISHLH